MGSKEAEWVGWVGLGPESAEGKMVWQGYETKPFEETDVEIEVSRANRIDQTKLND